MLADVVGTQVAAFRKRRGFTREALAEAVTKDEASTWNLTTDVLTNIETRRSKGRAGAREVTVDEVAALARVLGVPPLLLLIPVGVSDETDVGHGYRVPTWQGLRWFTGEARLDGGDITSDPGAAPLVLFRRHQAAVDAYKAAARELAAPFTPAAMQGPGGEWGFEVSPDRSATAARAALAVAEIRAARAEMRRLNLTPPPLPEEHDLRTAVGEEE